MVHPATGKTSSHFDFMDMLNFKLLFFNIGFYPIGYSVVRSLSEAPQYASVIATILKESHAREIVTHERSKENLSMRGNQVYL